jgi:Transglutaminase-like superfamily
MKLSSTEYYATPGRHTDITGFGLQVAGVEEAVRVVQGLLVYDLAAKDLYGVDLTATQAGAVHERDAAGLLELARTIDPRPLDQTREPGDRIGGRCNTYTLLTVSLLRAAGLPARSRCGFGAYFVPGFYEDHWVAEYWDPEQRCWTLVDAQLDDTWQRLLGMNGTIPATVGPEQFVTAGHAWQAWRAGQLDADRCGLTSIDEHGAFWIAGNLRLDLAALNKVEMLPWDLWGLGWEPSEQPTSEMLAAFDEIAAMTVDPDRHLDDLLDRYEADPSFRMDGTVFSVLLGEQQQL